MLIVHRPVIRQASLILFTVKSPNHMLSESRTDYNSLLVIYTYSGHCL